jgi:DNA-directed RNA polymerase subunit D
MTGFDIDVIDRTDRELRFVVRGVSPALANGVRRAILADVPTVSIDGVRFVENSSVMFDEVLALRLGLVPLTTPDDVTEGETVTLSLSAEGPGTAYSGDLTSSDELVQPAEENVPLIDLKEGQRVELEADAVLGRGRDHAKHQGGVAVGYRHLQRVVVGDDRGEYADDDPEIVRGVVEDDGELVDMDAYDYDLTELYPDREATVEDVDGAFVFRVESDGSLPVEELVTRAAESLNARAAELEDAVAL